MDASDVRQFFVGVLADDASFSDVDTSSDSNFDDLVVKPHMLFAKAIFDKCETLSNTLSTAALSDMTSDELDAVAAKFFVSRRTSSSLSLQITVYLDQTDNSVLTIATDDYFRTDDGVSFSPAQEYVFTPSALPTEVVNGQTLYIAKFTVVSNNATSQVLANAITSYTINHPALVKVVNLSSSTPPISAETDSELIMKIKNSVFTTNLVNRPAIYNNLTKNFSDSVVSVYSVGYGDPEMQRDIVPAGKSWSFHVGGTIDTFVRTSLVPITLTTMASRIAGNIYRVILKRYKGYDNLALDNSNPHPGLLYGWEKIETAYGLEKIETAVTREASSYSSLPELPLLYIDYASKTFKIGDYDQSYIETNPDTNDYYVEILPVNSQNLRYSIYEQLELRIHLNVDAGEDPTVILPYYTLSDFEDIQTHVSSEDIIFHCADNLVRSFIPVEIRDLTIKYDKSYTLDTDALKETICNTINNWNSPEHIRLSTLLSKVPAPVKIGEIGDDTFSSAGLVNSDGYISVSPSKMSSTLYNKLPTYIEIVQHNIDGSVNHFVATDQIKSIENSVLSATRRTVKYFIQEDNINFVPTTW